MKVYLLDTNIWSKWYKKNKHVLDGIGELQGKEHKLMMSPITWGEFAYGWGLDKKYRKDEFLEFINSIDFQFCKEIDKHTAMIYGELRALIANKYDPKGKKNFIDAYEDPTTFQQLGVQESDLWITSQAINLGATLVTADKKMKRIFDLIPMEYIGNKEEGFWPDVWER
ncbi:MAG: type II toxin-antitoxin system VapC family toxin [Sedimentisphaerales bacterium]|nr:type II toxin-antitoxin system VapC family toxin [Sedimentisphaerales bacterium]